MLRRPNYKQFAGLVAATGFIQLLIASALGPLMIRDANMLYGAGVFVLLLALCIFVIGSIIAWLKKRISR